MFTMWISLCAILVFILRTDGQQISVQPQVIATTQPPVRYALLLRELESVTNARKALQTKWTAFKQQYDLLSKQIAAQKAACHCSDSVVAFTAHLNRDVTVFGVDQPYPFEEVTLNEGNGYDARHAQFRAPLSGVYRFVVTLATQSGYRVAADMVVNDKVLVTLRSGTSNYFQSATNGVYLHLDRGDDVWVQHDHNNTDSNRLYKEEGMLSTFSGYLISRD